MLESIYWFIHGGSLKKYKTVKKIMYRNNILSISSVQPSLVFLCAMDGTWEIEKMEIIKVPANLRIEYENSIDTITFHIEREIEFSENEMNNLNKLKDSIISKLTNGNKMIVFSY
jgi:hypothetical protein